MGEEACAAVPVNDHIKMDPYDALRESVSFGRYASEPLEWGKWSSFCQNKYLEEAENCSARGSVAQKKAYFEAQYKKIAARKAAALLEQTLASETENGHCGFETKHEESCETSTVRDCGNGCLAALPAGSSIEHKDDVVVDELKVEPVLSETKGALASNIEEEEEEEEEVDKTSTTSGTFGCQNDGCCDGEEIVLDNENFGHSHQLGDEGSQLENKLMQVPEDLQNQHKDLQMEVSVDGQQTKSPLKESYLSNQESSMRSDCKRKSPAFGSSFLKKTQRRLKSSVETTTTICHGSDNTPTPGIKSSVKPDKDKQKLASQVNRFSRKNDAITQTVSKHSPTLEKVWNAKATFGCFKSFQDVSLSHRTPSKKTTIPSSTHAKASSRFERRCNKTPKEKEQPESQASAVKHRLFNLTSEKSCSSGGRKPNVSQSVSSFCFWNGERRKEYCSNLEEKLNAQKMEREAKAKEKAENELKLVRQSLGFKARPLPDFYRKIESQKIEPNKSPSKRTIFGWKRNSVEVVPRMNSSSLTPPRKG